MMKSRKAQTSLPGMQPLLYGALILAIVIILLIMMGVITTDLGPIAMAKIKDIFAFV